MTTGGVLLAAVMLLTAKSPYRPPPTAPPGTYVFAQTNRVEVGGGRTKVSAETNVPTPRKGYFPLRVFVDNTTGPRQTLRVGYYPTNTGGRPISKAVELREGERRTVVLPVPYLFRYGNIRVRGPGITEKGDQHVYFNSTYAPQRPVLSLGSTDDFEAWVGKPPSHSGGDLTIHALEPADAPTELAAYVGYDVVAVPRIPFEELPEGVRRALEAYAATGGQLVLGKNGRGLAAALPLMSTTSSDVEQDYGLGDLVVCGEGCNVSLASYFSARDAQVGPRATPAAWQRNTYRYADRDNYGEFAALLPQATAPIGRFLFIIGLFTLAIGPGSIWVARRRGPAALLITIPGTAFVTCALIIGYSLAQDGFTVHAATQGYTLLDSKQHRAVHVGLTAYYANLAPGSAKFSNLVAVVPPQEGSGEVYAPSIEWDETAKMGSDFVPSRSYREWGFVAAEPTRARVVAKRKDGGWVVQNALGSKIDTMLFMGDDALWKVSGVRDGAEARAEKAAFKDLPKLEGKAADRFSHSVKLRFERYLKEGEFVASVDGQGFTPSGGLRLSEHDSGNLVRGTVEQ